MFVECDCARILANPQSLRLLFVMVCRGLFEKDKLLYSATQLAILTSFRMSFTLISQIHDRRHFLTLIHFTSQFSSDPRLGHFLGLLILYPFCKPFVLSRAKVMLTLKCQEMEKELKLNEVMALLTGLPGPAKEEKPADSGPTCQDVQRHAMPSQMLAIIEPLDCHK